MVAGILAVLTAYQFQQGTKTRLTGLPLLFRSIRFTYYSAIHMETRIYERTNLGAIGDGPVRGELVGSGHVQRHSGDGSRRFRCGCAGRPDNGKTDRNERPSRDHDGQ